MNENNDELDGIAGLYIPRGYVLSTTSAGGVILLGFSGTSEMKGCANYLTKNQMKVTRLEDFNFTIKEVFKPGDIFVTRGGPPPPRQFCPHHGTELKKSNKPGLLFCPHKLPDGTYCKHTASV